MEFIESERGNQKLNIKQKKICGGQLSGGLLSGGLLSCSPFNSIKIFIFFNSLIFQLNLNSIE